VTLKNYLYKYQPKEPLSSDEISKLGRDALKHRIVLVQLDDDALDDFTRQGVINYAKGKYGYK
jgi:hypothetical protein